MSKKPKIEREILPIPDLPLHIPTGIDARDVTFAPIKILRPPEGAPNIIIVLIDDMGFGATSTAGGPCNMPTLDRLAENGLFYNRFHTTALCSPTRQALLTGRNHHAVGMGSVAEIATGAPGYNSVRPNTAATIAEILRLNGYNTACAGKAHQTPTWEVSVSGPFDRWPTGDGFEKFYGFIGGETNQWMPLLIAGNVPFEPWGTPEEGYHFSEDIVDKSIKYVRNQQTMTPDKPFFLYLSFGATHAPHHVPKEWIEKYKGKFDKGWDAVREETLKNMKEKGMVPKSTALTDRPEGVKPWKDLNETEKKLYARFMEVYAGFAEHTDAQVGRLVDELEEIGILDNTLIFYIAGDNGASAEGGLNGSHNELAPLNGVEDDPELALKHIDELGGPKAYNHYPVGWAHAMDCPYQWTKQVASHFGGTRNGLVVHWPNGIKAKGEIRQQFHHVIDVVPTILETAGLPIPYSVNGIAQMPIHGVSMIYSFDDAKAEDRHITQYFEMFGNRGIYHEGWTAVTKHRTPWITGMIELPPFNEDNWELYNTYEDWSQANDLSKKMPEKLRELQSLFLIEAAKYNVLPLDDRVAERFNAEIAGRPDLPGSRTSMTFFSGMDHLMENTVLNVKNKSHTITAKLEIPAGKTNGVIIAQGGRFAGWSLYVKDGVLKYCHNFLDMEYYYVTSSKKLPTGVVEIRYHFKFDGGNPGAGGLGILYVDDEKVGEARIEKTVAFIFAADETMDIGSDLAAPVTDDYPTGKDNNKFNGKIHWVRIDLGEDDVSHKEDPENKYHRILAKQ